MSLSTKHSILLCKFILACSVWLISHASSAQIVIDLNDITPAGEGSGMIGGGDGNFKNSTGGPGVGFNLQSFQYPIYFEGPGSNEPIGGYIGSLSYPIKLGDSGSQVIDPTPEATTTITYTADAEGQLFTPLGNAPSLRVDIKLTLSTPDTTILIGDGYIFLTKSGLVALFLDLPASSGETHVITINQWGCVVCSSTATDTWDNLIEIKNDWLEKERNGDPEALYAHFWFCLNNNACNVFEDNESISGGFNKFVFDFMKVPRFVGSRQNPTEIVKAFDIECTDVLPYDTEEIASFSEERKLRLRGECFLATGAYHFALELTQAFVRYCFQEQLDYERWDAVHAQFVEKVNLPCFDVVLNKHYKEVENVTNETVNIPDQIDGFKESTLFSAVQLRETVQFLCSLSDPGKAQHSISVRSQTLIPPDPASKEEMFSEKLAEAFPIHVLSNDDYFLEPGIEYELQVVDKTTMSDLLSSGATLHFGLSVPSDIATISEAGTIEIHKSLSPFEWTRTPLYVFVNVEDDSRSGIGQFAIKPINQDGDLLADSFEEEIGLDPSTPNDSDTDEDGLLDVVEAGLNTSPILADSDGDGIGDLEELRGGTDPLNAEDQHTAIDYNRSQPVSFSVSEPFPNPSSDFVVINIDNKTSQNFSIQVFDLTGRELVFKDIGNTSAGIHRIDLGISHLPAGLYILRVDSNALSSIKKLVVVH